MGKPLGWPHICGKTEKCGKNENPATFLAKAREHVGNNVELASADIPALGLPGFAASADANCSLRRKCRKLLLDAKMSECFKNFDTLRGALWTVYDTVGR